MITHCGVYATRGLYFTLLEQTQVLPTATGAPAGLTSLIECVPDILVGSLAGRFLDSCPASPAASTLTCSSTPSR